MQLGTEWYAEDQVCERANIEGFGRVDPELGAVSAGWVAEVTDIMGEILNIRPSYGAINARIKRLKERERADARRWYLNVDSRLKRQQAEEAASAESKRQFVAAIGTFTEVMANTVVVAAQVLAVRQAALAQAQQRYILVQPAYRPAVITQTTCIYSGGILNCRQISQ